MQCRYIRDGLIVGISIARGDDRLADRIARPKMLALAGVVAPIVFWLIFITAGLIRPGYDPVRQYGSELGIGPHAWLQNTNFILFGVLEMAFAYGLHRGINHGRGSKIGPALIAVGGLAFILVGCFTSTSTHHTLPGTIHARAAQIIYYSFPLAFFILIPRLKEDRYWRGLARYSLLAAILGLILAVAFTWSAQWSLLSAHIGLVQRILLAVSSVWLGVLALRLLAISSRSPHG